MWNAIAAGLINERIPLFHVVGEGGLVGVAVALLAGILGLQLWVRKYILGVSNGPLKPDPSLLLFFGGFTVVFGVIRKLANNRALSIPLKDDDLANAPPKAVPWMFSR